MSRHVLVINNETVRQTAHKWVDAAPIRMRIEFKEPKRSLPQNSRLWAMLSDVARQVPWHGIRLSPEDWKILFLDALKREVRVVPNLDGNGFVQLGRSSSDLSKEEMGMLMELIAAFGANHGVVFQDDRDPTEGL